MKKRTITLIIALLVCLGGICQDLSGRSALQDAYKMVDAFNSRNHKKYVDCLLPFYYGNNPDNKLKFFDTFERIFQSTTDSLSGLEILAYSEVNNEKQVALKGEFGSRSIFLIGISEGDTCRWLFTQPGNSDFNNFLRDIPTLDRSFAKYIDPIFGTRARFDENSLMPELSLFGLGGEKVNLGSKSDQKIRVINFWSISCKPCVAEIPRLNELVEKYADQGVDFLAITFNSPNDLLINIFLPKHPFKYEIVKPENESDLSLDALPVHLVVNKSGTIVTKLTGASTDNLTTLKKRIEQELSNE